MESIRSHSLERRAAPRSATAIRAYLISGGRGRIRGLTSNFSRFGVFLQTREDSDSFVGDAATLVFAVETDNLVRLLRYSVIVARECEQGYGLQFGRSLWSAAFLRRR